MMFITILGRTSCGWCRKTRQLCKEKKIPFTYKDIDNKVNKDLAHWMEIEGLKTVPQIFVDGAHVGGHKDLEKFLDSRT